jgi:hypothetical protein
MPFLRKRREEYEENLGNRENRGSCAPLCVTAEMAHFHKGSVMLDYAGRDKKIGRKLNAIQYAPESLMDKVITKALREPIRLTLSTHGKK